MPPPIDHPPTLADLWESAPPRFAERPALLFRRDGVVVALMMAEWLDAIDRLAGLFAALGIEAGEVVGLWGRNSSAWLTAEAALQRLGAVPATPHVGTPQAQAEKLLSRAGAVALIHDPDAALSPEAMRSLRWAIPLAECDPLLAPATSIIVNSRRKVSPSATAAILFTSGTTGEPKAVPLTHVNILANAAAAQAVLPFRAGGVVLNWLPFSHAYARNSDLTQCLLSGTTLALADSPASLRDDLGVFRPTNMHGAPKFYHALWREVGPSALSAVFGPQVDWIKAGGAGLLPEVARAYQDEGIRLLQGYGLTEAGPVIATCRRDGSPLGSVGRPVPGVEVRLSEDGELCARGPGVFAGYLRDAAATSAKLRDGWLRTGDLARMDEAGNLFLAGRLDEVIVLSSGKKVFPEPVERLIMRDSDVAEVVLAGPGRPWLSAWVAPSRPELAARTPAEWLGRWADALADLPPWERPRAVGSLPDVEGLRTASGKLRRAEVWRALARQLEHLERS